MKVCNRCGAVSRAQGVGEDCSRWTCDGVIVWADDVTVASSTGPLFGRDLSSFDVAGAAVIERDRADVRGRRVAGRFIPVDELPSRDEL